MMMVMIVRMIISNNGSNDKNISNDSNDEKNNGDIDNKVLIIIIEVLITKK